MAWIILVLFCAAMLGVSYLLWQAMSAFPAFFVVLGLLSIPAFLATAILLRRRERELRRLLREQEPDLSEEEIRRRARRIMGER